ncbi:OmpA family protein [uncultured Erythrobacter sp.]|uniref:OmpA family protein n=1 Tax=uncultured Erythrobacter sp. TaxID=263913 RepID=UPI00262DD489|nr:OmpA family protein [uncultured Erythrobacter sp.]
MPVIPHPAHPSDPNHVILTDFATNSARLNGDHCDWLDGHAARELRRPNPSWIYVRGLASRLGPPDVNLALSNRRAHSVLSYLITNPLADVGRLTGIDARGEEWSDGDERDDSARWRAAEVIISRNRMPVRHVTTSPPEMVDRITRRSWVMDPRVSGLGAASAGADGRGEQWNRVGRTVARHLNPDIGEQPQQTRRMNQSHRVNKIVVYRSSESQTVALATTVSMDTYHVDYHWGPPTPQVILNRHGRITMIGREQARPWIEEPGRQLF